jgi:hypothetical protein
VLTKWQNQLDFSLTVTVEFVAEVEAVVVAVASHRSGDALAVMTAPLVRVTEPPEVVLRRSEGTGGGVCGERVRG